MSCCRHGLLCWQKHASATRRKRKRTCTIWTTRRMNRLVRRQDVSPVTSWKESLVWWIVATAIGCGWAYRGRTKDIIIYGCSRGTAPIATDGTGRREAEETAVHFHEGRLPGWLGSNSSEYSSASGFAYRDTSLLCPRVKIIAQRVSATVGKRICLVCTGKVPTSRRWWLRKTSRTMANSTVEWERLNNNTHRTISGTNEQLSVCWDKWWEPDEGIYMCMWGSRYRCPTGNSVFFQRQWQDDGKGMRWDVSSRACGVPLSPIPVNATELITRPRTTPPTVPLAVAQEGECPKTTKGPGNGLVLIPTDQVLYQGVHYAVASVILNLTEMRLPEWCPRETERLTGYIKENGETVTCGWASRTQPQAARRTGPLRTE
ncbi:uncharacterized protein LOC144608813 [Rhinoraja longicauda]